MRPTDVGSDDGTTARAATAGRSAARGSRPGKKRKRPGPCCQARGPRWLRTGTARLEAGPERKERGGGTAVLPLGPRPNPSPGWSGRGRPAYPIRRAAARAAAMPGDRRRRQPPDSSSASALCLRGARGRALPQLPRLRPGSRVPAVASAAQRAARPGCCLCRAPGRASPLLPRPDPGPRAPPLLHRLRSGTRPCSCLGCAPGRAPPLLPQLRSGPPRALPLTLAPGSSGRRSYNPGPIAGGPASSPAQHSSIPVRSCRAPGCCSSLLPSAQRNSGPPRLRAAPPAPARPR